MNTNYERAFGFLESAVHRALWELDDAQSRLVHALESDESMGFDDIDNLCAGANSLNDAQHTLRTALNAIRDNHGIELHWPDDVKDAAQTRKPQARCEGYQFSHPNDEGFFCGRAEFHGRHFFVRPDDVKEINHG